MGINSTLQISKIKHLDVYRGEAYYGRITLYKHTDGTYRGTATSFFPGRKMMPFDILKAALK